MSNERIWQVIVSCAICAVITFAVYRSHINEQLYLQCLEANGVLLESQSSGKTTYHTHYCRY